MSLYIEAIHATRTLHRTHFEEFHTLTCQSGSNLQEYRPKYAIGLRIISIPDKTRASFTHLQGVRPQNAKPLLCSAPALVLMTDWIARVNVYLAEGASRLKLDPRDLLERMSSLYGRVRSR